MKRILLIIIGLLVIFPTYAQKDLQIESLFDGSYKNNRHAVEVKILGKQLRPYNLSLFRSLTIENDSLAARHIEQLVLKDGLIAVDKEEGIISGRLFYGFYCLPPTEKIYRYLFFRNTALRRTEETPQVTVVYMEGFATMEELQKMFKK